MKHDVFLTRLNDSCKLADTDFWPAYRLIAKVCSDIFLELSSRGMGNEPKNEVSERDIAVQRFFYEMSLFDDANIPEDRWQDVAKETVRLIYNFISSNDLNIQNLDGYSELIELSKVRKSELEATKKFRDSFKFFGF